MIKLHFSEFQIPKQWCWILNPAEQGNNFINQGFIVYFPQFGLGMAALPQTLPIYREGCAASPTFYVGRFLLKRPT